MRQQLITWLIEDIAPEIKRSRDAEGELLKFARSHNLATAQVQALGQLYNTAKTLSFFEKSASRKGDPFPIMDVDGLLDKFTAVEKSASHIPYKFEYDDQDRSGGLELPACFAGLTHNVLEIEQPAPAVIFDNPVKQANANHEQMEVTLEFAKQAKFEYLEEMRKLARDIVTTLRRNPNYQFDELEADSLGILGDDVRPIMDKLAKYCQDDGWPVKRATAPSQDKLVQDPDGLIPMVEGLLDNTYRIKAAEEMLQPNSEAAHSGPPLTAAKIVEKKGGDIVLKAAGAAAPPPIAPGRAGKSQETPAFKKIDPAKHQQRIDQQQGGSSPKDKGSRGAEDAGQYQTPSDDSNIGGDVINSLRDKVTDAGATDENFRRWSKDLDELLGPAAKKFMPGQAVKALLPRKNVDQLHADTDMQDAKHIATLQNLMTTDEILAEADPEHIVQIYNTIRQMAPEMAGDTNVMRVLLRSAVQHEGISPFDMKAVLDAELAKQRVSEGQQRMSDRRYSIESGKPDKSDKGDRGGERHDTNY